MIMDEMLAHNMDFVKNKEYEKYKTSKIPNKGITVITCMDTRLIELLPQALGFKNGDVKIIKNAGGMITSPFDSTVRSALISVYEQGVAEIMVIGHKDCEVTDVSSKTITERMLERGITQETLDMISYCEVDMEKWLAGFDSVEESVKNSVNILKNHPLMPKDVHIAGYIIDIVTGGLKKVPLN